jgi:chorismate mutase
MKELEEWRRKIDEIDRKLVRLLNERSQSAVEIGRLKKKLNLAAWQPEREAEILRNVVKTNQGPLDDAAIRRLFERIIDEARALERHAMEAGERGPKE